MKTILHLIPHAHLGGTEKDCFYIVAAGKDYFHKIFVLGSDGPIVSQWKAVGADVAILNILEFPPIKLVSALHKEIAKETDVVGVMYWSTIKLPLIRIALSNLNVRLAVHVGNPSSFSFLSLFKFHLIHLISLSNIETALFCCSDYVRQSCFTNSYYKKFELRVSLNPVKLLTSNPFRTTDLTSCNSPILGMTARLDPIKDHVTVIRAFALVLKDFPLAQLWLLGDGILRLNLEQLCTDLNIKNNVVFYGNVANVYDYLQKLDIFVYATTPAEGLGNVVSEALANGLPCVVSNLPMMYEVVGQSEAALFFEQGEEMQLAQNVLILLKNKELRITMSDKAFLRARHAFSSERYFEDRIKYLIS